MIIILLSHWLNKAYSLVLNTGILLFTIPWMCIVWFVFLPFAFSIFLLSKIIPYKQEDEE